MNKKFKIKRAALAFATVFIFVSAFLAPEAKADSSVVYTEGTTPAKLVSLTFDDGDPLEKTQPILDILDLNGIKATFFINGIYADAYPDSVLVISEAGHEIGNHAYSHTDLTTLSYDEIQSEMDDTESVLSGITGKTTKPLFRPPYGSYDSNVLEAVGDAGYTMTVNWSLDSKDYNDIPADEIYSNVVDNIFPGAIVLLHTGDSNAQYALQDIIDTLTSEGYTFVTASDIVNPPEISVLAGDDRYATAAEISKASYAAADTAILATGINFPDALSAGPLAVLEDAPVLLTQTGSIPQATADELTRLKVKKVIIMGGEDVVEPAVAVTLAGMGITVERVSGSDRYATAVEAAKLVRAKSEVSNKAVLATGLNFPDALCIGAYAAREGIPILLTEPDVLNAGTKAALADFKIEQIVIAGGPDVVSQSVENELAAMGIAVTRSYGDTRYGTSASLAGDFFPDSVNAIAATGLNYPDALAAVPLAAKMNAPILLVTQDAVPEEAGSYLKGSRIADITVIGGDDVVGQSARDQLLDLLK